VTWDRGDRAGLVDAVVVDAIVGVVVAGVAVASGGSPRGDR